MIYYTWIHVAGGLKEAVYAWTWDRNIYVGHPVTSMSRISSSTILNRAPCGDAVKGSKVTGTGQRGNLSPVTCVKYHIIKNFKNIITSYYLISEISRSIVFTLLKYHNRVFQNLAISYPHNMLGCRFIKQICHILVRLL